MDRARLVLVALPIFLLCRDISVFLLHLDLQNLPKMQKTNGIGETGIGSTINIDYCVSCSYRENAITMKNTVSYPGITVILANHPASFMRLLSSKLVPVFQIGVIGTVLGGDLLFQRLGMEPPLSWYESLKANRFGSIASSWILGNVLRFYLEGTGAFEVSCNGELVFSKLREDRFPSEIELRDLIGKKLADLRTSPKADIK